MVYELARPAMREGVEDGHREEDAVEVAAEEPKLDAGAM
jgi:hypothetical protein